MKSEIILTLLSGIFLAAGFFLWQRASRLLRYGKKTLATVIDNEEKHTNRRTYYYPVLMFTTEEGEKVGHTLAIGYSSPMEKGTIITIIYDPEDTGIVSLDSRTLLELLPRLLVVAGLCGLVLVLFEVFEITQLMK